MSDRKQRPRTRNELESQGPNYHHPESQYPDNYHSVSPHMATYASYPPPPRQQYAYPYHQYHGHRGDPSSSPPEGFHPPLHRYLPRSNPNAVSPESGQVMPAEFMSPPSNVKRRTLTPGSSLTPSKRARTGAFLPLVLFHCRCCSLSVESQEWHSYGLFSYVFYFVSYILKFGRKSCLSDCWILRSLARRLVFYLSSSGLPIMWDLSSIFRTFHTYEGYVRWFCNGSPSVLSCLTKTNKTDVACAFTFSIMIH